MVIPEQWESDYVASEETINGKLRETLGSLFPDYTFIKGEQSAPAPDYPYGSVTYTSYADNGLQGYSDQNSGDDIERTSSLNTSLMFSINFYGDSSLDDCRSCKAKLIRSSVLSEFKKGEFSLQSMSEIRKLTETIDGKWEHRHQFDIIVNTISTDSETVNTIANLAVGVTHEYAGVTTNLTVGD